MLPNNDIKRWIQIDVSRMSYSCLWHCFSKILMTELLVRGIWSFYSQLIVFYSLFLIRCCEMHSAVYKNTSKKILFKKDMRLIYLTALRGVYMKHILFSTVNNRLPRGISINGSVYWTHNENILFTNSYDSNCQVTCIVCFENNHYFIRFC